MEAINGRQLPEQVDLTFTRTAFTLVKLCNSIVCVYLHQDTLITRFRCGLYCSVRQRTQTVRSDVLKVASKYRNTTFTPKIISKGRVTRVSFHPVTLTCPSSFEGQTTRWLTASRRYFDLFVDQFSLK